MSSEFFFYTTLIVTTTAFTIFLKQAGVRTTDNVFLSFLTFSVVARWLLTFNSFYHLNDDDLVTYMLCISDISIYLILTLYLLFIIKNIIMPKIN